ncbi:Exopolysaccharide biosynthesis transcriptional activator EpsA [Streptococcus infantarius subsp. infantarius]|nr:Exopolysaccharide biosynthesis transcriptional activator EpsA [Streptococcus infantarius subsp. infantarius]MCO4543261.1 Exopolysaccharide biosynthesis transcriptional activator EpsA [Streptococcus infantarius subsp. infantarius]
MRMISVIVPVYNAQEHLSDCVDSLLNQSLKSDLYEIILLNDGSKDQSAKICEKYAKKYSNIVFIDKKNEGVSKTRNQGIQIAKGDFVAFVDNDDLVEPDYLATLYQSIMQSNADAVFSGYTRMTYSGKVLFKETLSQTEWSKYVVMAPWAKLYRKQILLENQVKFFNYGIGEDVVFNLQFLSKANKIEIIGYSGYRWMFNDDSVSNTSQRGLDDNLDIRILLAEILKSNPVPDDYLSYFIYRYYIWYLLFSGRSSNKKQFLDYNQKIKTFLRQQNIFRRISPLSKKLKGEKLSNRLIVLIFSFLDNCHLLSLFAIVYCKDKK